MSEQGERNRILRKLLSFGAILLAVFVVGTIGFYLLGGPKATVLDALFMTVVTIATIGFGEITYVFTTPEGKIFTMLFALSGITLFTYILSNLAAYIIEGELQRSFRHRRIETRISKMQNHYIVCGGGRIGLEIIRELANAERQFLLVEMDEKKIKVIVNEFPQVNYLHADATEDSILVKAGAARAYGIFAAIGDDNANLVVGLTAKHLNPKIKVVSRALQTSHIPKMEKAGADIVVSPHIIGARHMYARMFHPNATRFMDLQLGDTGKDIRMHEVTVSPKMDGTLLGEMGLDKLQHTLLISILEGEDYHFKPNNDFSLKQGQVLLLLCATEDWVYLERNVLKL
jgi:voltage-gated potassium channel